jgi:hypothetical protein
MKIYADDKLLGEVDSSDRISNRFVWEKLAFLNVTDGKHTLKLENVVGFNAVNMLSLVPSRDLNKLETQTSNLLNNRASILYYLEAESIFYNTKGTATGNSNYLLDDQGATRDDNRKTDSRFKIVHGTFKVPAHSDLATLGIIHRQNESVSDVIKNWKSIQLMINMLYLSQILRQQEITFHLQN